MSDASKTYTFSDGELIRADRINQKYDDCIDGINTRVNIETGAGAPSSTPDNVGDLYMDTTAKREYRATGTS